MSERCKLAGAGESTLASDCNGEKDGTNMNRSTDGSMTLNETGSFMFFLTVLVSMDFSRVACFACRAFASCTALCLSGSVAPEVGHPRSGPP